MVFSPTHGRAFEEASGRFGRGNFSVYFVVSPFLSIILIDKTILIVNTQM